MHHRVVERAGEGERPEGGALRVDRGGVGRRRGGGAVHAEMRGAALAVDLDREAGIAQRVAVERALDGRQRDALGALRAGGLAGDLLGDLLRLVRELARRDQLVDQPPLLRALAAHALGGGAEEVGVVAPHHPLVDQPRQAAGAGQHREQRQLGQRHRARAIVGQQDLVAGQRQLIAAAGGDAVDRADVALAGMFGRVLDGETRLVGELAEVHLVVVGREPKHVDIGARAEDPVALAADHHRADLGMLEAQPLHGIGQLDVDAEIVGVELELVAGLQPAILVHVHGEVGDAGLQRELPMLVTGGLGAEVDGRLGHGVPYIGNSVLKYLFTFPTASAFSPQNYGRHPPRTSL